ITNDVVVARDGAEALELLFESPTRQDQGEAQVPGLVLLDLKLPKVDGLQVLAHMRADERTRFVPVVLCTSSREDRDVAKAYRLGANSYICKPVDFAKFADAVGKVGLYWLGLNELPLSRSAKPRLDP